MNTTDDDRMDRKTLRLSMRGWRKLSEMCITLDMPKQRLMDKLVDMVYDEFKEDKEAVAEAVK